MRVVGAVLAAQCDYPPLLAQGRRGLGEVFAVLATPRVRGVGGGGQDEDAPGARLGELVEPLGDEGVPVAVSPTEGDVVSAARELRRQVRDQAPITGVDGRDAAETLVVSGDLEQALVGDSPPTRGVAHERQDILRAVRAAVGQQHDRVIAFQSRHLSPPYGCVASVGTIPFVAQRQNVRKRDD